MDEKKNRTLGDGSLELQSLHQGFLEMSLDKWCGRWVELQQALWEKFRATLQMILIGAIL